MALDSLTLVRILEGAGLVVGLIITYFALKAYGRSKQKVMIVLAIAFIFLTTAGIAEGVLFEVINYDILSAQAVRSAISLAGLISILYAIRNIE